MKRWLALVLGLAIVALAVWVLAAGRGDAPLARIDADSRERLERVLEQADRESGGR